MYVGRFAPSPTGPLHAGSLVAALASWLDARAHGGRWLVRIEDVDSARSSAAAGLTILSQLSDLHLHSDEEPWWQSNRSAAYEKALEGLLACGLAYPCSCSRSAIAAAHALAGRVPQPHRPLAYPGTCRAGMVSAAGTTPAAWRFACEKYMQIVALAQSNKAVNAHFFIADGHLCWTDRLSGFQSQNVASVVGDFILKRADGDWAYQLAVVADDAAQSITHVVRGADLAHNTPRQILLGAALAAPPISYMHTPLVLNADGIKLSKQHGAAAIETSTQDHALRALTNAAAVLGLAPCTEHTSGSDALAYWVQAWRDLYNLAP